MKTVNLEKILKSIAIEASEHGKHSSFDNNELSIIFDSMKEACRQVLELAVENTKTLHHYYDRYDDRDLYDENEMNGFVRTDEDGIPYGVDVIEVDKQSILDTFIQVIKE